MPLYRYACGECHQEFTTLVSFGSKDGVRCRFCGSPKVKKLLPRFFSGRTVNKGTATPVAGTSGCSTCSVASCTNCHR